MKCLKGTGACSSEKDKWGAKPRMEISGLMLPRGCLIERILLTKPPDSSYGKQHTHRL